MKKLLALLLAAMMVLASVSALAEATAAGEDTAAGEEEEVIESPVKPDPVQPTATEEDVEVFSLVDLGPVGQQYLGNMEAAEEVDEPAIGVFTPAVQDALKELLGDNTEVNEMFGVSATWDESMGEQYLVLEFATEYKAGEPVAAVLVLVNGEEVVENVLTAEVIADYTVRVYLPIDMMNDLVAADEAFIAIVNAAAAE